MKGFGRKFEDKKKGIQKNLNSINKQIIQKAFHIHSQGNIIEAAKLYQYLIKQGLNNQNVFSNYGGILKDLGNLKDAELYTRKAIEINPGFAVAHLNLGRILKDLGNLKDAELHTRKAIEINPNFAMAHLNLGGILKDLGNLKDAELHTRKAIKINPDFPDSYLNLGGILRNLGKLKDAESCSKKIMSLRPWSIAGSYSFNYWSELN